VTEFTGERVIPGAVNDDLWAEHLARYVYAANFVHGGRILDLGCGTGYGIAELSSKGDSAVGIDPAPEAITYARAHYPRVQFIQGSATALPFRCQAFHLITAFEVIEHLENWAGLISEARRTLHSEGVFLVSTPNRLYYAESRGPLGPNPFHVHEFTFDEFQTALKAAFPHVLVCQQNRTEAFAFSPGSPQRIATHLDSDAGDPHTCNFFVAACAINAPPQQNAFIYIPKNANLLREREQHIELLQRELQLTNDVLAKAQAEHKDLVDQHANQTRELEEHNRWTLKVVADWKAALDRIAQLQDELKAEQAAGQQTAAAYAAKVAELEEENRAKTQWAIETDARLSRELAAKCDELLEAVRLLDQAEATVTERTVWAQGLQNRVQQLEAQMAMIRQSRWIKVGRAVGVGPRVQD
jgi:SAM-dependent methyltransferase